MVQCLLLSEYITSGEDLDKVGGAEAGNSFMTLSDTSSCGKMTALAKLLDLWYMHENANKVVIQLLAHWLNCLHPSVWHWPAHLPAR